MQPALTVHAGRQPAAGRRPFLTDLGRREVRLSEDPRSSPVNTDGQIFSDCGVPVVLFMENYDISRKGYHDTKDTLENIDLDYGAGGNDERLAERQAESCVSGIHLANSIN